MDFSSITGDLENMAGELMGQGGIQAVVSKVAGATGADPALLTNAITECESLLADGKITQPEIEQKITEVGTRMGVPQALMPMLLSAVVSHLNLSK